MRLRHLLAIVLVVPSDAFQATHVDEEERERELSSRYLLRSMCCTMYPYGVRTSVFSGRRVSVSPFDGGKTERSLPTKTPNRCASMSVGPSHAPGALPGPGVGGVGGAGEDRGCRRRCAQTLHTSPRPPPPTRLPLLPLTRPDLSPEGGSAIPLRTSLPPLLSNHG